MLLIRNNWEILDFTTRTIEMATLPNFDLKVVLLDMKLDSRRKRFQKARLKRNKT